jgi:hypothetical protein
MKEIDQDQQQLFIKAWCPLFGKLPPVPNDLNDNTYRCVEIIKSARLLWGVNNAWLKDLKSSWSDPSKIDGYPTNYIVSARILYGATPSVSAEAERKLDDPDDPLFNEAIYEDVYNIDFHPSGEDIDLKKVLIDIQNKFYEFRGNRMIDDTLELEQAYAIRAINLAWIALYNGIADNYYLYEEEIYKMILNAESLLSLAKDGLTESAYETGRKVINGGRRGGESKGISTKIKSQYIEWQKQADLIWKKDPNYSKRRVAFYIAKKDGGNLNTIRKIIKK